MVMFIGNFVFDSETTAQFSAFEDYICFGVIWKYLLTLFFMGEGKVYPAKIFLLMKNYGRLLACRDFSANQI